MNNEKQCPNCGQFRMMNSRKAALIVSGTTCILISPVLLLASIIDAHVAPAATAMLVIGLMLLFGGIASNAGGKINCMNCGFETDVTKE